MRKIKNESMHKVRLALNLKPLEEKFKRRFKSVRRSGEKVSKIENFFKKIPSTIPKSLRSGETARINKRIMEI